MITMSKATRIIIYLGILTVIDASRILFVTLTPSESHHIVFRPFIEELLKKRHEITLITSGPHYSKGQTPANLTVIDVKDALNEYWQMSLVSAASTGTSNLYEQVLFAYDVFSDLCDLLFQQNEVKSLIHDKSKQFDLLILEAIPRPLIGFSHVYKAPVILFSTFYHWSGGLERVGAMVHPLHFPTLESDKLYNLTLLEKIKSLYEHFILYKDYFAHEKIENEMLRGHFGEDIPPLSKLEHNIDMFFMNLHKIWDNNRPVPPNFIHLGSMQIKNERKELPQDIKSFLDSSKNGVIYMSFGTSVNPLLLPQEIIQMFIKVFSQLPYDVLWKWNKDDIPGRTENIRLFKWLPQSDVLKHPKVKLFITQGGLQSTDESIAAGVPMIGVPMFADQWYNTEKYVHHKIGIQLKIDDLSESSLKDAINTVINNKSYRNNVANLRTLMFDAPQTSLERAVWWTEYVLRNRGAKHLRAPTALISYSEYYEAELVLILTFTLLIILVMLFLIFKAVFKYTTNKLVNKIKHKTN